MFVLDNVEIAEVIEVYILFVKMTVQKLQSWLFFSIDSIAEPGHTKRQI